MSYTADEVTALLNKQRKGKSVQWQEGDQEIAVRREGETEAGPSRDLARVAAVDVVKLRDRVRDLERQVDDLGDAASWQEAAAVGGAFLLAVAVLICGGVWASKLSGSWVGALGVTSVALVVLTTMPPAAILLWKVSLRR